MIDDDTPGAEVRPADEKAADQKAAGERAAGERGARVAIVTGAGQGIGRAIAAHLVDDGWRVVVAERDADAGAAAAEAIAARTSASETTAVQTTATQQTASEMAATETDRAAAADRSRVRFVEVDVSDEAGVAALVRQTLDAWGRIDGLVNNAGLMVVRPVTDLDLADWRRVVDTNLTGAYLTAKHAAPALSAAPGGGAIVNIASTRARMSEPDTEAYAASKGGLVALSHALAISLGPLIRVNCVSPGWIDTTGGADLSDRDHAQHPAGRVGEPRDVADLVGWLLSPAAGFVTGADFVIDGGMTRKMIYE